jgi:hypothetical protein
MTTNRSAFPFMPQMGPQPPQSSGPGGKTLTESIKSNLQEGASLAAFYQGLGINPSWGQAVPQQAGKTEVKESTTVDLGTAFKAMTDQNATMMNAVLNMSKGTQAGAQDPFVQFMVGELKEMKTALQTAKENPHQVDPWQAMDNYVTRYDGMMEKLKKNLNLPANLQLGTGNESTVIQLKNMELQQLERNLQFEERKHQWDVEREDSREARLEQARRFNMEHNLKIQEIKDKQARSENVTSWVQDLAGAFVGAIDPTGGSQSLNVGAQPPSGEPPTFRASSLLCGTPNCETRVKIPAGATEVVCPKCQMGYEIGPEDSAPPQSQPAEAERSLAP